MTPADAVLEVARISRADYRRRADGKALGRALDTLGVNTHDERLRVAHSLDFADPDGNAYPVRGGEPIRFW